MAIAEIPTEITNEILTSIGKLGLYIQAIGLIIIVWLAFQIASLVAAYKNKKRIKIIQKEIEEIKKIEKEIKEIKKILKNKK